MPVIMQACQTISSQKLRVNTGLGPSDEHANRLNHVIPLSGPSADGESHGFRHASQRLLRDPCIEDACVQNDKDSTVSFFEGSKSRLKFKATRTNFLRLARNLC